VRRFARDFLPATRSSGPALDAGLPLGRQLRGLLSEDELGGLVKALRPTVPSLTRLNRRTPALYEQVRLSASCQNEQILPWTMDKIEDPVFPATGRVFEEGPKPLSGLAGESRSGDANGQWFRVLLTGGVFAYQQAGGNILQSSAPLMGVNPPPPAQRTRPFRPDVPCETQEQPDLRSTPVKVPNETRITVDDTAGYQKVVDRARREIERNTPDNLPAADRAIVDAALKRLGK